MGWVLVVVTGGAAGGDTTNGNHGSLAGGVVTLFSRRPAHGFGCGRITTTVNTGHARRGHLMVRVLSSVRFSNVVRRDTVNGCHTGVHADCIANALSHRSITGGACLVPSSNNRHVFVTSHSVNYTLGNSRIRMVLFPHHHNHRRRNRIAGMLRHGGARFINVLRMGPAFTFLGVSGGRVARSVFVPLSGLGNKHSKRHYINGVIR